MTPSTIGFDTKPLKWIAGLQVSNVDKKSVDGEIPVRLCNYTDVYYADTITPEMDFMVATATANEISKFRLRVGDVLITKDSEDYLDIGVPAYVAAQAPDLICGYHLAMLRPDRTLVYPRFLFWAMASSSVSHQLSVAATGLTRYGLRQDSIASAAIPYPPLLVQEAIAGFLDRETARIDELVDKKIRLTSLLEEKHSSLIAQAVTGGLDDSVPMRDSGSRFHADIPEHWELLPLRRLTSQMTNGYVGPTRDILIADGVPYVQSLHVKNGRIQHNADYFVSEEWHRAHDRTRLREGDLLLVQTGDIGQSAVVNRDSAGANCHALIISRFRSDIADPWYFGYAFRAPGGKAAIVSMKTGATHPHLNVRYVREVSFPVPPMGEQRRIVGFLDAETRVLTKAASLITSQLSLLGEYRQALITAAVTGQIDVAAEQPEPEGATI